MEAKRRKLEASGEGGGAGAGSPAGSSSSGMSTRRDAKVRPPRSSCPFDAGRFSAVCTEARLKGREMLDLHGLLGEMKKVLVCSSSVSFFIQPSRTLFPSFIALLTHAVEKVVDGSLEWPSILRLCVSILGNCCHVLTAACLELVRPHLHFVPLAGRLLESSRISCDIRASSLRLVGNLCAHKETALSITQSSTLVDRVCVLIGDEDMACQKFALRTIRLLASGGFAKQVLLSNAGYYLGRMLAPPSAEGAESEGAEPPPPLADGQEKEILDTLKAMARHSIKNTGRQLASSECSPRLLDLFLSDGNEAAKQLVVHLCDGSPDFRDRLGEIGVIKRIIDLPELSDTHCRMLVAFAQDAWGRMGLRESGAMEMLVDRFASADSVAERNALCGAFRHFMHDTQGMAHLCRNRVFVDTVVRHINEYVARVGEECVPEMRDEDEVYRPDSPLLMQIETDMRGRRRSSTGSAGGFGSPTTARCKDFAQSWSYSPSPTHSSPAPSSPAHSSSDSFGGVSGSGASSPARSHNTSILDDAASTSEAPSMKAPTVVDERKTIIDELWLLAWQSQEDANLPHLIREDLISALLSLVALARAVPIRACKALRRLAAARAEVGDLLLAHFHLRVMWQLCAAPCTITRRAQQCGRCYERSEFGRDLLREFARHVDSDFGHASLLKSVKESEREGDAFRAIEAAIAHTALVRDTFRSQRLQCEPGRSTLQTVLGALRDILEKEGSAYEEAAGKETYREGPPLVWQLVSAIGTLLPAHVMRDVFEHDAQWRAPDAAGCVVKDEKGERKEEKKEEKEKSEEDDVVRFVDTEGALLASVRKSAFRQSTGYFEGLFSSDMVEMREGRREFVFDEAIEMCNRCDFTRFLHFVSGCRVSPCVRIDTAESCAAMIQLSDRYLCPSLLSHLVSPHGPARRLLFGQSLVHILPAALTVHADDKLMDACLVTLFRYCCPQEMITALATVAGNATAVDLFMTKLSEFLRRHAKIKNI